MVTTVMVQSIEEIAEIVRTSEAVFSHRYAANSYLCPPTKEGILIETNLDTESVRIEAENQIAIVDAGIPLGRLQQALFAAGYCLPFPSTSSRGFIDGYVSTLTVREAVGMNFPHAAEAEHGNWRDWIVGMTVVLGDGTIAKSGSQAVKNVAGYDAHKLFVGARGTLGVIAEVILRIKPQSVLKSADVIWGPYRGTPPHLTQRVLPTDFESAIEDAGEELIAGDPAMGTIWRKEREREIRRFANDWLWRSNGEWSVSNAQRVYLERAKELLDPDAKLNPGLLGIF